MIAGFVPSTVAKHAIGALVLGEHVGGKLVPSGHVGSGFSATAREPVGDARSAAHQAPRRSRTRRPSPRAPNGSSRALVAEIEYRSRTGGGLIRHATFRELVEGADPAEGRARSRRAAAKQTTEAAPPVRLTNPGRLLWPEQGITKQGLADFYTEIADWILPHIVGPAAEPGALSRRRAGAVLLPEAPLGRTWATPSGWCRFRTRTSRCSRIDDLAGLLELVQASVLEIHPWGVEGRSAGAAGPRDHRSRSRRRRAVGAGDRGRARGARAPRRISGCRAS